MTVEIINGQPWKQQYETNYIQSEDISGWAADTSLPAALYDSSVVVTKNRVYLLGGYQGSSPSSTVYTAAIDINGIVGAWSTTTSLPAALGGSQAILTKSRIYLLGGVSLSYRNWVYTAPVSDDGIIGTWVSDTGLPAALGRSQAVITKNRVYLLGGFSGTGASNTVYTAPISESGVIGTWATDTSIPGVLGSSQAVVTKNRVYLLGGQVVSASALVYTAAISDEGIIGVWSSGTSLPAPRVSAQSVVTNNEVYLIGGDATTTVIRAQVDTDGMIGSWGSGTSIPGELSRSQVITTASKISLLGGLSGLSNVSTVYSAPFDGGYNDYTDKSWRIPPFWTNFKGQTELLV